MLILRVESLIGDYNATDLKEELENARDEFSQGNYQKARERAKELRRNLRERVEQSQGKCNRY